MAKKKKTFAQKAKEIQNKYKTRLGEDLDGHDKYAQEALKLELEELQKKQMALREKKGLNQPQQQFETGGTLPKKRGTQYASQYLLNNSPLWVYTYNNQYPIQNNQPQKQQKPNND